MPAAGRIGDKSQCPSDAHGCPGCAHSVIGPAITGSADVLINGIPAVRVGDLGVHSACCGSNMWTADQGSTTVFINGKAAFRMGDPSRHCGGMGKLIEGSSNVFIDDSGGGGGGGSGAGGGGGSGGGGGTGGGGGSGNGRNGGKGGGGRGGSNESDGSPGTGGQSGEARGAGGQGAKDPARDGAPTGKPSRDSQIAHLNQWSYNDQKDPALSEGMEDSGTGDFELIDNTHKPSGFVGETYLNRDNGDVVVVFRGTVLPHPGLVATDVLNAFGVETPIYREAAEYGQQQADLNPDGRLVFTGHSLGGGLAIHAARTLRPPRTVEVVTFNPASPFQNRHGDRIPPVTYRHYVTDRDVVSYLNAITDHLGRIVSGFTELPGPPPEKLPGPVPEWLVQAATAVGVASGNPIAGVAPAAAASIASHTDLESMETSLRNRGK